MPSKRERKLISKNRSAHHEYFIDETFECGIELSGTEVKSIRERACQITDTFALIRGGECWLVGLPWWRVESRSRPSASSAAAPQGD